MIVRLASKLDRKIILLRDFGKISRFLLIKQLEVDRG